MTWKAPLSLSNFSASGGIGDTIVNYASDAAVNTLSLISDVILGIGKEWSVKHENDGSGGLMNNSILRVSDTLPNALSPLKTYYTSGSSRNCTLVKSRVERFATDVRVVGYTVDGERIEGRSGAYVNMDERTTIAESYDARLGRDTELEPDHDTLSSAGSYLQGELAGDIPSAWSVNDYLVIGTEFVKITAVSTDSVTISRGENGSGKYTHYPGESIVYLGSSPSGSSRIKLSDVTYFTDPSVSGHAEYALIGREIIRYTGLTGSELTGVTRNILSGTNVLDHLPYYAHSDGAPCIYMGSTDTGASWTRSYSSPQSGSPVDTYGVVTMVFDGGTSITQDDLDKKAEEILKSMYAPKRKVIIEDPNPGDIISASTGFGVGLAGGLVRVVDSNSGLDTSVDLRIVNYELLYDMNSGWKLTLECVEQVEHEDSMKVYFSENNLTNATKLVSSSVSSVGYRKNKIWKYDQYLNKDDQTLVWDGSSSTLTVSSAYQGETIDLNNASLISFSYINGDDTEGDSGYGIRDNSGVIEFKDSGGSWTPIASGSCEWTQVGSYLKPDVDGETVRVYDSTGTKYVRIESNATYNIIYSANQDIHIQSDNDVVVTLGDDGGAYFLRVKNSSGSTVASISSLGNIYGANVIAGLGNKLKAYDSTDTNSVEVYHNGTNGYIASTSGGIVVDSPDDLYFYVEDDIVFRDDAGAVSLSYDKGLDEWTMSATLNSHDIIPTANSTYDIGSSSNSFDNGYFGSLYGILFTTDIFSSGGTVAVNSTLETENVVPLTDATYTLGSTTNYYSDGYVTNIHSDRVFLNELVTGSSEITVSDDLKTKDVYPASDSVYDLGTSSSYYNRAYINDVYSSFLAVEDIFSSSVNIYVYNDLITSDIEPASDSTYDIGTSSTRFANGYFDNIYYTGGSLPDDKDDIALIREKYTPEKYNGGQISLNDSLGLCIGAIKQIADKLDSFSDKINKLEESIKLIQETHNNNANTC